jgi:uncharacterized protein (DUF608 family)
MLNTKGKIMANRGKLFTYWMGAVIMIANGSEGISGTAGTPLGGFGSGAVKYSAQNGYFSISEQGAPLLAHDFTYLAQTMFQLFVKRGASITVRERLAGLSDDAQYPLHRVDFGSIDGIAISMTGYSPLDFGDVERMALPCALYEFTVHNAAETAAQVSCALQLETPQVPVAVAGRGFYSSGPLGRAAFVDGDGAELTVSVGADSGFFSSGRCSGQLSGSVNRVAALADLAPGQLRRIRIVLAWYFPDTSSILSIDPALGGVCDRYYFTSRFANAAEVADTALQRFDAVRQSAETLVGRFGASNLPPWFKQMCLTSLSMLSTNSILFKDLRMEFTEGKAWADLGTMDQMWHARWIWAMLMPEMTWKMLEYWAATQRSDGQLPHDFGKFNGCGNYATWNGGAEDRFHNWYDHPGGFIIGIYESYISSADSTKLRFFWPKVKRAAERIVQLINEDGQHPDFPYTVVNERKSSYDAGGTDNRIFNSAIA